MGRQIGGKLNWLQHNLPEGLVVDAAWLERHGYSSALRSKYVAHNWLDAITRGVYRRPPTTLPASRNESGAVHWQPVVISLQTLLACPLTVGGRTALELQGFAHYLAVSSPSEIHLYGTGRRPGWVSRLKSDSRFVFHNARKLFKDEAMPRSLGRRVRTLKPDSAKSLASGDASLIRQPWGHWEWPLTMSAPERAVLELLDEVPQRETFHQADMLMEGLRNLSPGRLHKLLVTCRSVKVKRLFLWFAERHNHAWLKRLDRKGVDLGQGKRMLVRGGKFDTRFNITVPETLDAYG